MPALTVRLSQEEYDSLKIRAVIERKKLVALIREALNAYLEQQGAELDEMKRLLVEARAGWPVSRETAMKMAEIGARLDDQEGLGPIQVIRGDKGKSHQTDRGQG